MACDVMLVFYFCPCVFHAALSIQTMCLLFKCGNNKKLCYYILNYINCQLIYNTLILITKQTFYTAESTTFVFAPWCSISSRHASTGASPAYIVSMDCSVSTYISMVPISCPPVKIWKVRRTWLLLALIFVEKT